MNEKKRTHLSVRDSEKANQRLRKLWELSGNDKDKFKQLVEKDKIILGFGLDWRSCDQRARLSVKPPLYNDGELSNRFWASLLAKNNPGVLKELDAALADSSTPMSQILERFGKYGPRNDRDLRNYARDKGIKIQKNGAKISSRDYDARLTELIHIGILLKSGINEVLKIIKSEFPDSADNLTAKSLLVQIEKIIWDKAVEEALKAIVGNNLPLNKFTKLFKYIPEDIVRRRAKKLTGLTKIVHPVTFLRGLGRIGNLEGLDEGFQLPDSSFEKPFVIPANNVIKRIRVINGPNIGLRHERLIHNNPVRRALADASRRGIQAVLFTNLLDVDTRKAAGGLRVLSSMASGLNTNEKLLDPDYRAHLKEKRSKNEDTDDKPSTPIIIYETVAERFMNALAGCYKVSHQPGAKKKPEFNGPILIILGYKDEEMASNAVNWEVGYWTRVKQNEIEAEIKAVTTALNRAKRLDDWKDEERLGEELRRLSELKSRTIISNVSTEDLQRYTRKVLNFMAQEIERAIPNSKVIGKGNTFVKVDNEIVEIYIPSHLHISDALLADYNKSYGAQAVMQIVPETTIICHPYALGYRTTAREIAINDKRAEARAYVAPIAVDGKFLREALRDMVRSVHPIAKAIFSTQFSPGVLDINFYPGGNISADPVPIESLAYHSKSQKITNRLPETKYIWIQIATDPHFGSRMREEVWSDKAKGSLGMSDAVIQMFRDAKLCQGSKLPVHLYTVNDDPTQANHFGTQKQPHPRQMSHRDFERTVAGMTDMEKLKQFIIEQNRLRGTDWLNDQIKQVKQRHIEPNLDFFSAQLNRVAKSGLLIRGISDIHKVRFDRRDLGASNWGTGNHLASELDRAMTEGEIYADHLRALLLSVPEWRNKGDLLKRLVVAPMEGNEYFAWGTVQIPGGYEWAIEFRSDPPRMASWADPLLGAVRNDATRGDYGLFMTGRKTLKVYGDKHFFGGVKTEHVYYAMGAPGTSTDLYGHRGFPPNNTGITFIGLPVGGPDSGPILLRTLHVEHIRRYFEEPYEMDWGSFLPNPA